MTVVEGAVIDALGQLVMKLSETLFRPLFLQAFDWALTLPSSGPTTPISLQPPTEEESDDDTPEDQPASQVDLSRSVVFYRLLGVLAQLLKGLLTPYFGQLLDPCAYLLEALHPTTIASPHRAKRRRTDESSDDPDSSALGAREELLRHVLDALHYCALYDSQGLLDAARFPKVMEPVVAQLDNTRAGIEVYKERASSHLLPCIVQFAVTVHDDQLWKPLHHAVLTRTRSDILTVRLTALEVVRQLFERLGEAYLVMMPETVPYLAECMEDSSPEVEALTKRIIKDLETLTGESMQEYFK